MNKKWIRVTAAIAGFLAACVVVWAVSVATSAPRVTEVNPAEVADVPVYLISDYRHPTSTPTPTPEPVVVEAPVEEVYEEPVYVSGGPGDTVPFIPSDDPNNANGGDYIDPGIYCQSGSASGNPPTCD